MTPPREVGTHRGCSSPEPCARRRTATRRTKKRSFARAQPTIHAATNVKQQRRCPRYYPRGERPAAWNSVASVALLSLPHCDSDESSSAVRFGSSFAADRRAYVPDVNGSDPSGASVVRPGRAPRRVRTALPHLRRGGRAAVARRDGRADVRAGSDDDDAHAVSSFVSSLPVSVGVGCLRAGPGVSNARAVWTR
jgi:hypothetical protein